MALHWDPFGDLLTLPDQLDRLTGSASTGWSPPVDLFETPDHYEIVVEVPGLPRDHIQLQLEGAVLTIQGRRPAADVACERYHCMERGYGRFSRSFPLREPLDAAGITADLRDGVLTIRVPKTSPRRRLVEVR